LSDFFFDLALRSFGFVEGNEPVRPRLPSSFEQVRGKPHQFQQPIAPQEDRPANESPGNLLPRRDVDAERSPRNPQQPYPIPTERGRTWFESPEYRDSTRGEPAGIMSPIRGAVRPPDRACSDPGTAPSGMRIGEDAGSAVPASPAERPEQRATPRRPPHRGARKNASNDADAAGMVGPGVVEQPRTSASPVPVATVATRGSQLIERIVRIAAPGSHPAPDDNGRDCGHELVEPAFRTAGITNTDKEQGPRGGPSDAERIVNVSIGRIEVRAVATRKSQKPRPAASTMSLEDYLTGRQRGRS
jgi:hypothetical protein